MKIVYFKATDRYFIAEDGFLVQNKNSECDIFDTLGDLIEGYKNTTGVPKTSFSMFGYINFPERYDIIFDFNDFSEIKDLKSTYPEWFI